MIIKLNETKLLHQLKETQIAELKQLLADSDYKVLPDYDKDNSNILALRASWRDKLRELEK